MNLRSIAIPESSEGQRAKSSALFSAHTAACVSGWGRTDRQPVVRKGALTTNNGICIIWLPIWNRAGRSDVRVSMEPKRVLADFVKLGLLLRRRYQWVLKNSVRHAVLSVQKYGIGFSHNVSAGQWKTRLCTLLEVSVRLYGGTEI